jgi:hypothetical protein
MINVSGDPAANPSVLPRQTNGERGLAAPPMRSFKDLWAQAEKHLADAEAANARGKEAVQSALAAFERASHFEKRPEVVSQPIGASRAPASPIPVSTAVSDLASIDERPQTRPERSGKLTKVLFWIWPRLRRP